MAVLYEAEMLDVWFRLTEINKWIDWINSKVLQYFQRSLNFAHFHFSFFKYSSISRNCINRLDHPGDVCSNRILSHHRYLFIVNEFIAFQAMEHFIVKHLCMHLCLDSELEEVRANSGNKSLRNFDGWRWWWMIKGDFQDFLEV